jgi:hypothetical protein
MMACARETPKSPEEASMSWQELGAVAPAHLKDARLQLHWAAQIIGATARSIIEPTPDDSHTSASWSVDGRLLEGQPTRTDPPVRVGLGLSAFDARVIDAESRAVRARRPLDGSTLDETFAWLVEELVSLGGESPRLERPSYDMPAHDVQTGGRFEPCDPAAFEEMEGWFANAAHVLQRVSGDNPNASPVRVWPHHFDIATLVTLDPGKGSEEARSINVGMSPGDDTYEEPYWYVSPWPYPRDPGLPELESGGHWHTEGFLAAVLPAGRIVEAGGEQEAVVQSFVDSAVKGAAGLLEAGD